MRNVCGRRDKTPARDERLPNCFHLRVSNMAQSFFKGFFGAETTENYPSTSSLLIFDFLLFY